MNLSDILAIKNRKDIKELQNTGVDLVAREQINDLEAEFDVAVGAITVDSEVVLARGGETTLGNRLDKQSSSLDANMEYITSDGETTLNYNDYPDNLTSMYYQYGLVQYSRPLDKVEVINFVEFHGGRRSDNVVGKIYKYSGSFRTDAYGIQYVPNILDVSDSNYTLLKEFTVSDIINNRIDLDENLTLNVGEIIFVTLFSADKLSAVQGGNITSDSTIIANKASYNNLIFSTSTDVANTSYSFSSFSDIKVGATYILLVGRQNFSNRFETIENDLSNVIAEKNADDKTNFSENEIVTSFIPPNNFSDLTVIDGNICCFKASDNEANYGTIFIYSAEGSLVKNIGHGFGHCNVVDYCEYNDTLVVSFEDNNQVPKAEGKFYLISDAKNKIFNATEFLTYENLNAIEYDMSVATYGELLNVCFGYNNYGKNDIIIATNNTRAETKIVLRMIQLGKGSHNLGLGVFASDCDDNTFNGSFKVLQEYEMDNTYQRVVQGLDYYNGTLYMALGHLHSLYREVKFNSNNTVSYVEVYHPIADADGNLQNGSTEGIAVTQKYIIENICTLLGNRVEVRVR